MGTATLMHRPVAYSAKARWCTVRIETDTAVYVGRLYITDGKKRISDVLCDDRPFLNLVESTSEGDAFVAINKRCVRTVRVLEEAIAAPVTPS